MNPNGSMLICLSGRGGKSLLKLRPLMLGKKLGPMLLAPVLEEITSNWYSTHPPPLYHQLTEADTLPVAPFEGWAASEASPLWDVTVSVQRAKDSPDGILN